MYVVLALRRIFRVVFPSNRWTFKGDPSGPRHDLWSYPSKDSKKKQILAVLTGVRRHLRTILGQVQFCTSSWCRFVPIFVLQQTVFATLALEKDY